MKRLLKKKDGYALMIAMVIAVVVMLLSTLLLLVSYSLFASANREQDLAQSRELAQTVSRQLGKEIMVDVAAAGGAETDYPLWMYLKNNINISENKNTPPTSWPYYENDTAFHDEKEAYRYFTLDATGLSADPSVAGIAEDLRKNTEILMYWECENADAAYTTDVTLTVVVTCRSNGEETTVTNRYQLDRASDTAPWKWKEEYE